MDKKEEKKDVINNSEETKEPVKKDSTDSNKKILSIIGVVLILIIAIFVITNFMSNKNSNNIKSVKRVLKEKYSYIDCIDTGCNGFIAIKGDKLKKATIDLINEEGKKVASYKEIYNSDDKMVRTPYELTNEYFLMKSINSKKLTDVKYSIMNKRGKEIYKTDNRLEVLNDKFISMENEKEDKYTILNLKGKEVYNNISSIDTYLDGKYITFKIEDVYTILDEDGNKILDNYRIAKVVRDEDNSDKILYFIVEDVKNDIYYYYNINKSEIVGDGFNSYKSSEENGEFIISKNENDKTVKYILNKKGKQTKIEDSEDIIELVNEIKEKIDKNEYYLYSTSITKKGQKNILVDNKKDKSLGILNLDTNKYTKLYSYNTDKSSFSSTVEKLNEDDSDLYLRISCSERYCEKPTTIIYDFEHTKEVYSLIDENLMVSDYVQYESGYKVVKYSSSSKSEDYKGKYVLYDKNDKELLKSSNRIAIVDKNIEYGDEYSYSLTLYSAKQKKALNKEDEDAKIITIAGEKLYKYTDSNDNTVICNLNGEKVVSAKDNYLKYSNTSIVYLEDEKVSIYDVKKSKTRTYKLRKNEKINDASGDIIPPYNGAVFINNTTNKYVKVVDSKAKVIKKIKKVELVSVEKSSKNDKVFIIVKKTGKTGNLYGLYMTK